MPGPAARRQLKILPGLGAAALCLLLSASPGSALAQDARANSRITEADCRNRAKTDEEVVVCGRRSGEDPYRIPKGFRKPADGQRKGTALAVDVMGSGIPGANSNIGGVGSVGSAKAEYEQWLAEKKAAKKAEETPQ